MDFCEKLDEVAFTIGERSIANREVYDIVSSGECQHVQILELIEGIKDVDNPIETANNVAAAFKRYGLIHVDGWIWHAHHKMVTIMDRFEVTEYDAENAVEHWLIYRAFKYAGFKYAADSTFQEMFKLMIPFLAGPYYFRQIQYTSPMTIECVYYYDYELIADDHRLLHAELIEFLHHPYFIQKWIEAGNDLEDYLA